MMAQEQLCDPGPAATSPGGAASGSTSVHLPRPSSPLLSSASASTTSVAGSQDAQNGIHPNLFLR